MKKDANYSKLSAVSKGRVVEIPAGLMQRQGQSALEAIAQITAAIYPSLSGSGQRSEEHTSELQSRDSISYAVFCLKKPLPS